MHRVFWMGVYPGLTPAMIDYMLETIHEFTLSQAAPYRAAV